MSELTEELSILLPSIAETLKCVGCNQYLSVLPIIFESGSYFCGRCTPIEGKTALNHAVAYENLAKLFCFPCKYDSLGCLEILSVNEMEEHEKKCTFQTTYCPVVDCYKYIGKNDVLNHFQSFHSDLIVKSNDFKISSTQTTLKNQLLMIGDKVLIMTIFSEKQEFFVGLRSLNESVETMYQLEVQSENGNTLTLSQQSIKEYVPAHGDCFEEVISFNYETVKSVLKSDNVTFKVKLLYDGKPSVEEKKINPDDRLLEDLECIICKEYMQPPIFICKTGHSLCSTCKNSVQVCPICQAKYEGARNYTLEHLSEHLSYPSKNQPKATTTAEVSLQEKKSGRKIKCPLSELEHCKWKGFLQDVFNHSKRAHTYKTKFKLNQTVYRNLNSRFFEDYYIVMVDNNLFRIYIKDNDNETLICFGVQHVNLLDNEEAKYQVTLNFVDQTGTGRILTVNSLCCSLNRKLDFYSNNAITLPDYLFRPFLQNRDKLMYSMSITRLTGEN